MTMPDLAERHEALATESKWDFSDLRALFINCTLKRSPEVSNTRGLGDLSAGVMEVPAISAQGKGTQRRRTRGLRLH